MRKASMLSPGLILRKLLSQLDKGFRKAAKSPEDPDAVHDLRVAIRRVRQALRMFPDAFGQDAKKARRQLKKVMTVLGAVRNYDIIPAILKDANARAGEALLKAIQKDRQNAQKELEASLKAWQKQNVMRKWKPKVHSADAADKLFEEARMKLPGLAGEFFETGNYVARKKVPYSRMHRCRLLGKQLRYSIEMFEMDKASAFQARFKTLKQLQDELGSLNDCVTVIGLIQGYPAVKTCLRELRGRQEKAFRTFWNKKFDRKAQQWWLQALAHTKPPQRGS